MFIHFQNYAASIVFTCKSDSKRLRTFLTTITQIRTFSLNLGIKNSGITKYSSERSFQERKKKRLFKEKHCALTLQTFVES